MQVSLQPCESLILSFKAEGEELGVTAFIIHHFIICYRQSQFISVHVGLFLPHVL